MIPPGSSRGKTHLTIYSLRQAIRYLFVDIDIGASHLANQAHIIANAGIRLTRTNTVRDGLGSRLVGIIYDQRTTSYDAMNTVAIRLAQRILAVRFYVGENMWRLRYIQARSFLKNNPRPNIHHRPPRRAHGPRPVGVVAAYVFGTIGTVAALYKG
ncbi:hypothetical protein PG991_003545 [Apiospora marii]|uniref:Uncharacterized protein n=1 Tax=Apiospora marii TaxID=335849 RepID=A0ABR1S5G8_9PEZI